MGHGRHAIVGLSDAVGLRSDIVWSSLWGAVVMQSNRIPLTDDPGMVSSVGNASSVLTTRDLRDMLRPSRAGGVFAQSWRLHGDANSVPTVVDKRCCHVGRV